MTLKPLHLIHEFINKMRKKTVTDKKNAKKNPTMTVLLICVR